MKVHLTMKTAFNSINGLDQKKKNIIPILIIVIRNIKVHIIYTSTLKKSSLSTRSDKVNKFTTHLRKNITRKCYSLICMYVCLCVSMYIKFSLSTHFMLILLHYSIKHNLFPPLKHIIITLMW